MKTLKEYLAKSKINPILIRAVVKQIGGWTAFRGCANDVDKHGADSGFSGFIYYSETVAFTKRHKPLILDYAREQAASFGADVFSMLASFNCLELDASSVANAIYSSKADCRRDVFNALTWYALEEVARDYVDYIERG